MLSKDENIILQKCEAENRVFAECGQQPFYSQPEIA
jgi:hypothetical protein